MACSGRTLSRANDDSLLGSESPYISVRAVLQRRTRTDLFSLRGTAFLLRRLELDDLRSWQSTARCLEVSRPNAPDVKRRSILGGLLGPVDLRSFRANDDSLLGSESPDVKRGSISGGMLGPVDLRSPRANNDSLLESESPDHTARAALLRRARTDLLRFGAVFSPRRSCANWTTPRRPGRTMTRCLGASRPDSLGSSRLASAGSNRSTVA